MTSFSEFQAIRQRYFAEGYVKVRLWKKEVDFGETVWAKPVSTDGLFRLENDPFGYPELVAGDVVRALPLLPDPENFFQWDGEPPVRSEK